MGSVTRAWSLALVLTACGSGQTMPNAPSQTIPSQGAGLRAAARTVDITPPPGLGLFGHGPESRVSVGTRLRLRCQILVLSSQTASTPRPEALALVTCDLGQPSLLVQRRVAELVREAGAPIGADRIVLAATHTHAGPAHYFAARNLSGTFSSRLLGFDENVVELLASRIADEVVEAWNARQPARAGWAWRDVRGLSRNRSLPAFRRNRTLPEPLRSAVRDPELLDAHGLAQLAVDPRLSVLRVDAQVEGAWRPIAAWAVFGVHPTVIDNTQDLYGGDVFGYAAREVERRIAIEERTAAVLAGRDDPGEVRVVAALANGIEGDVAPLSDERGPGAARRLGDRLAAHIVSLWLELGRPNALDDEAPLDVGYRELTYPGAAVSVGRALCATPELGTPAAGGASDNPTSLRLTPQLNSGVRSVVDRGCHGRRFPLLQPGGAAQPGRDFPAIAPIVLARIGNGLIATLPTEATTVAGLRIREGILDVVASMQDPAPTDVAIVGLAQEYMQYTATAEEYEVQLYEGASTLYGPATAAFLADQHRCLAERVLLGQDDATCRRDQPRSIDQVGEIGYDPAPEATRLHDLADAHPPADLTVPRAALERDGRLACELTFHGPGPRALRGPDAMAIEVWEVDEDGQRARLIDDDRGSSVEVRWLPEGIDDRNWLVHWVPELPSHDWRCGRTFRFVVRAGGDEAESRAFRFHCGAPACEVAE